MSVCHVVRSCTLAVLLFSSLARMAAEEPQPFDTWVPEDILAFASLRSVEEVERWLEKSPLYDLWRGADLQPFVKALTELIEEAREADDTSSPDSAGGIDRFLEYCRGEIAIVLARPGPSEDTVRAGILVDVGEHRQEALDFVRKATEEDEEYSLREREFRGERMFVVLERQDGDSSDPSSSESAAFLVVGNSLVVGSTSAFVEQILVARADEDRRALAQNADYRYLRGRWGASPAVHVYVNTEALFPLLPEIAEETDPGEIEVMQRTLEIFGLSGIRKMALSLILAGPSIDVHAFFLVPGSPRGLVKMLWTKPQALRFPSIVPEDANSAFVMDLDFGALYDSIEDLVRLSANMEGEGRTDSPDPIRAAEEQLELSFRRDLVEALTGRVVEYERVTDDLLTSQSAFLFELRNKERFQSTIERLLGLVPFLFQKSAYLGRPVYTLNLGLGVEEAEGDEAATPQLPAMGITDTHFVFGMSRSMVEEAIRRVGQDTSSLSDAKAFREVAGELPPTTNLIVYQSSDVIRVVVDALRQIWSEEGESADLPEGIEIEDPGDEGFGPDLGVDDGPAVAGSADDALSKLFGALPEGRAVSKYFRGSITYGVADERGFGYTWRTLLRKE